jgi:hypothetical protein
MSNFLKENHRRGSDFKFTVNMIINPGPDAGFSRTGNITISTQSKAGTTIEQGSYRMKPNSFVASSLSQFNITVPDPSIGHFPSRYGFTVKTTGKVSRGASYMKIDVPKNVDLIVDVPQICGRAGKKEVLCKVEGRSIMVIEGFNTG